MTAPRGQTPQGCDSKARRRGIAAVKGCANIGRAKKPVKQKTISTSQIVCSHPVAAFVHLRLPANSPYYLEGDRQLVVKLLVTGCGDGETWRKTRGEMWDQVRPATASASRSSVTGTVHRPAASCIRPTAAGSASRTSPSRFFLSCSI